MRRGVPLLTAVLTLPAVAADITFYEHDSFRGRSFVANQSTSNFANVGYNDRAASLRIEGGYWLFCSEAQFEGECQTFGPGDYPNLAGGFNNRISSGRRINNQYPYSQNPMWQRP